MRAMKRFNGFEPFNQQPQLLRRLVDEVETLSPELFEHYILIKEMPIHLRMKIEEDPFIAALHIILLTLLQN